MTNDIGKIRELLEDQLSQESSQVDESISSPHETPGDVKAVPSGVKVSIVALSIVAGVMMTVLIMVIKNL